MWAAASTSSGLEDNEGGRSTTLAGKSAVVVTGTLDGFSATRVAAIKARGGEVARQRLGEDDRRRRGRRARGLQAQQGRGAGHPILDEAAFTHLLDTGELPA